MKHTIILTSIIWSLSLPVLASVDPNGSDHKYLVVTYQDDKTSECLLQPSSEEVENVRDQHHVDVLTSLNPSYVHLPLCDAKVTKKIEIGIAYQILLGQQTAMLGAALQYYGYCTAAGLAIDQLMTESNRSAKLRARDNISINPVHKAQGQFAAGIVGLPLAGISATICLPVTAVNSAVRYLIFSDRYGASPIGVRD